MVYKTSELLYKSKKKKIRLADTNVNVIGPAGMGCSCRPDSAKNLGAKYSTIGLILDMIFIDHKIMMKENDSSVYVKFEMSGTLYEGLYNGDNVSWVDAEPKEFALLIPEVAWVLSDHFTSENADELKGYFRDIKDIGDKNAILFFCDIFYYAFARKEEFASVVSECEPGTRQIIDRCFETGSFADIPLMEGLDENVPKDSSVLPKKAEYIQPEKEETPDFTINWDGWTPEQRENIPDKSTLDDYVMTDTTLSIAKKVKYRMTKVIDRLNSGKTGNEAIGSDYINILMVGRPGTGKTALANAVAAMTGMPIYTVPFSKHTEEDTAEGKNKVVQGKIDFVETDLLKAYENGGIIVLEEINLADPGVVMGSLGQAIEKPFIIMKDGYKPVHRNPLCVIIGTMNTGTAGSRQLNQALSSRFKCTYTLDDPDRNTFINILMAAGYPKRNCKYVYDAYHKVINYLKDPQQSQEDLCENITLRACFGALECMEEGDAPKQALHNSIVGKIAEVDLEVAKQVDDMIISSLPDLSL